MFTTGKVDDNSDKGDKYVKRLLDRSQYSDRYSQNCRRRLSVMGALNRNKILSPSNRNYDGNAFEKEFSQVNSTITAAALDDDQLEMTYVSTWPGDNSDTPSQTDDVEPHQDNLYCVKSHDDDDHDTKATSNRRATEARRSSEQFRTDIVDTNVESSGGSANLGSSPLNNKNLALFADKSFGSLTSNELKIQSTLNLQFDKEFEQCSARLEVQGPDEYFGTAGVSDSNASARFIEICEPTIIEFHRKSYGSEAAGTETREADLTYVKKDDNFNGWKGTDLDTENPSKSSYYEDIQIHKADLTYAKKDNDEGREGAVESVPERIRRPSMVALYETIMARARDIDSTYVKNNNDKGRKVIELDTQSTSSSLDSENLRELDRDIDRLQLEHDDDSDKTATASRNAPARFKIFGAKKSRDTVDAKDNVQSNADQLINRSSTGNYNDNEKTMSPKNATFSVTLDNSTQQRGHKLSKTASFIKRHTSFLFKNLRTPKLMRRKSSVESRNEAAKQWSKISALVRSNTMDSSDNETPTTRFQRQVQQVKADLPPDVDDTMASEMESFLKLALGSGHYNSTMAQANVDLRDPNYSVLTNNERNNDREMREPKSEPPRRTGTLNRTLSMYKTLTQKIRDKFRKYDHNDPKPDVLSTLYQQYTLPADVNPQTRKVMKELQLQLAVQDTRIYQTSKALDLCDSKREFIASPERVEYERVLLMATLTRRTVLREIDLLIAGRSYYDNETYSYSQRGEVTLKDIRLQLREDMLRRDRQNGDVIEWFVVVVIQGVTVWSTAAIACPISSAQIFFPGVHTISGLTPDFRLSIKVYSMKLQQLQLFNHDEKYHIASSANPGSAGSKIMIKTPKMLRRKSFSPKQHKVKFTGMREPLFAMCGAVDLMLYDLKLLSPWPLSSFLTNSVLQGTIDLNLSCRLELSMFHVGFLTHCEETGDLAWSRRWCLLEGHKLLFWNYPREQEYNPPLYMIDLVDCVSSNVDLIDRRLCPRPKTLLLETRNKTNEREQRIVVVDDKSTGPVHRHLLSCDTNDELSEWHSKLNHVVSALSDWNIIHPARTS